MLFLLATFEDEAVLMAKQLPDQASVDLLAGFRSEKQSKVDENG